MILVFTVIVPHTLLVVFMVNYVAVVCLDLDDGGGQCVGDSIDNLSDGARAGAGPAGRAFGNREAILHYLN